MLVGRKTCNIELLKPSDLFWVSWCNGASEGISTHWAWTSALTYGLDDDDMTPVIHEVSTGIEKILLDSLDSWHESRPEKTSAFMLALVHMSQGCPDEQTTEDLVNQLKINRFPARLGSDETYLKTKLIKSIGFPFGDAYAINHRIITGLKGLRGGDIRAENLTMQSPSLEWKPCKLSLWSMQIDICGDITHYPYEGRNGKITFGTIEDQIIASCTLRLRDFTGWCRQQ